jgi:hypothetical protein
MIQRAAYEKEIKEQDAMDSDDEDVLGVFEGDDIQSRTDIKGKGKRKETTPLAIIDEDTLINPNKRRRPVVDPFAGAFNSPSTWSCVIDYDEYIQDTAMILHHPIVLQPPKKPQKIYHQRTAQHPQTVTNDLNQRRNRRKRRRTRNVYIAKVYI